MQDIDPTSAQTQIVTLGREPEKPRPRTWVDVFWAPTCERRRERRKDRPPRGRAGARTRRPDLSVAYGPEAALDLAPALRVSGVALYCADQRGHYPLVDSRVFIVPPGL